MQCPRLVTRVLFLNTAGYMIEKIDISAYVQTGEGANGCSYDSLSDPDEMLKLYNKDYPEEPIYTELEMVRKVYDLGIPSPEPGNLVTDGERLGIRFRRIRGKRSHARAVSQEPERVREYAVEFARMCKNLHTVVCPDGYFPDAKIQFMHLLDADRTFSDSERGKIREFLLSLPDSDTVLHGDMHFGNTLTTLQKGEPMSKEHGTYFIDLGYFARGYPLLDLGMLYNVCLIADEEFRQSNMHMGRELSSKFWNCFVDEYFFGPEKLAEKYFGPGTDRAGVDRGMRPVSCLKLFLVEFNLGFMPPHYEAFIRDTFGFEPAPCKK